MEHAGVTAEEATVYRVKADYEDGRAVYDVEFAVGATEYDYEIAQEDGAVLSYDSDVEGWAPVSGENQTSSQGAGPVSQEEATQLVLDRVPGAAESDVRIRLTGTTEERSMKGSSTTTGPSMNLRLTLPPAAF